MADVEFVTINLSKKQVDMEHPYHNEKNGKDYLRIFAPGGGTLFYPADSIKVDARDERRVYFSRPVGTELQLHFSMRNKDVPDEAPAEEKYTQYDKTVRIEDLKEMYEEERKAYLEQKQEAFVNMEIPTEWGKPFEGKDGVSYVSVSVPIKENEERHYYNFVISADSFRDSTREKDMSYFGFPRKKKDTDEDYMVTLKRSVRQEDGSYEDVIKEISSTELAEHMEAAKRNYSFINVEISDKLVRGFEGKDGTPYVSVSVPVYDEKQEKDIFYQIVVDPKRIMETEKDKVVCLSMFRKGGDGNDYVFHAEASILTENGEYQKQQMDMTSMEVANCFKSSRERFKQQNTSEGHSLGDEIRNGAAAEHGGQAMPGFRPVRRGGR